MEILQKINRFFSLSIIHKQLMNYMNGLSNNYKVSGGSKTVIKVEFNAIEKSELLSISQLILKKFENEVIDLEAVFNSNPELRIQSKITISLKSKLPIVNNAYQTKININNLTEYSVSTKYGGMTKNDEGYPIFYTNVGSYYVYRKA